MAPEVFFAFRTAEGRGYDGRLADSYSLGATLCFMLTGEVLFRAPSVDLTSERWQGVSEPARQLVSRLMQVDPNNRSCVSDVLQHPWVLTESTEGEDNDDDDDDDGHDDDGHDGGRAGGDDADGAPSSRANLKRARDEGPQASSAGAQTQRARGGPTAAAATGSAMTDQERLHASGHGSPSGASSDGAAFKKMQEQVATLQAAQAQRQEMDAQRDLDAQAKREKQREIQAKEGELQQCVEYLDREKRSKPSAFISREEMMRFASSCFSQIKKGRTIEADLARLDRERASIDASEVYRRPSQIEQFDPPDQPQFQRQPTGHWPSGRKTWS